jgi:hypothetical protein
MVGSGRVDGNGSEIKRLRNDARLRGLDRDAILLALLGPAVRFDLQTASIAGATRLDC